MRWICCIRMLCLIRAYFLRYAAASGDYTGANDVFGWPAARYKIRALWASQKNFPHRNGGNSE